MTRIDITSTAVSRDRNNFEQCRLVAERYGIELGVQIHNTAETDEIETLKSWSIPLSLHAPVSTGRWAFNFASRDAAKSWELLEHCAKFMRENGISKAVFHGFFMSDGHGENFGPKLSYDAGFRRFFRSEYSLDGVSPFNNDFTAGEEFLTRREILKTNLAEVTRRYPDLVFHIENDFPCYTSGNMLPKDLNALDHEICFDVGHLWATCHLLHLDFQQQSKLMFAGGKVKMVHLHASKYTPDIPIEKWGDGHLPFNTPNQMNLPELIRMGKDAAMNYWVLEIVKCTPADVEYLARRLTGDF